jgi:hypothetical protein
MRGRSGLLRFLDYNRLPEPDMFKAPALREGIHTEIDLLVRVE